MTSSRLPGMYFQETVQNITNAEKDYVPLFLIQTSTAIADLDEQITHYTGFDAFETKVAEKGLTYTSAMIEQVLQEYGNTEFYVYSIKTDTITGFTNAIKATSHLQNVKSITYIEETASANANKITDKIGAIKAGLIDNATNGVFREGFIIPYGTVSAAVEDAENTAPEAACITSLTSILTGEGHGRICCILPDENAGTCVGKCISANYDEEPGYTAIQSTLQTSTYNFDKTQMLTLENLGVIFIRLELLRGNIIPRINLGVTTGFKSNTADQLLVSRTIADEILRQIEYEGTPFVKAKEVESNVTVLQTVVDGIIDNFTKNESIIAEETAITVTDAGNSIFTITGTIKPIRSVIAIEVNTKVA